MSTKSSDQRISCDGGGALGHPVVWYWVSPEQVVRCQYCGATLSVESETHDTDTVYHSGSH